MPYLRTLGSIEMLITELDQAEIAAPQKNLIRISLYKSFFEGAITGNLGVLGSNAESRNVLSDYRQFMRELTSILLRRKSTILSKEINLFTTNVDIFLECGLEALNLEVNDGFNGRFHPRFSLSHFKTSRFKKSLHFDNIAELPIFNLLKLHGSLSWRLDNEGNIHFSPTLELVASAQQALTSGVNAVAIDENATLQTLVQQTQGQSPSEEALAFMRAYEQLPIVNPTKEKFKHTLLNQTYYELLRIYSNELEKENTVLFALGFSFADEHIREITLRAANSNPTLVLLIYAYDKSGYEQISARFPREQIRNGNIFVVAPPTQKNDEGVEEPKYLHTLHNFTQHVLGELFRRDQQDEENGSS